MRGLASKLQKKMPKAIVTVDRQISTENELVKIVANERNGEIKDLIIYDVYGAAPFSPRYLGVIPLPNGEKGIDKFISALNVIKLSINPEAEDKPEESV